MNNKRYEDLLVIVIYIILTLIFTYPIIFRINNWMIGMGGDTQAAINVMWWFEKSFLNPNLSFYYTTYLYYPTGSTWALSEVAPFLMIVSLPLQILVGRIAAYNLLILSSFVISSFGVYLLVEYLTGDKRASLIAGVIFAFCPQHFMQALVHVGVASVEWVPFFILYFLKTMKEGRRKDAVLASLFLSFASLCSWFNAVYLFLFVGLYLVFCYLSNNVRINRKTVENLLLIGILSSLLILPFAYPMLIEIAKGNSANRPPGESVFYSADLVGFLVSSTIHPLFGKYVSPLYDKFGGNVFENTTYIGYTVIFLVVYFVLKHRKNLGEARFWWVSSVFFFILSLGPVLHILGDTQFTAFDTTIPLPYILLYYIPPISMMRVPSRLSIMFMLSMSVLVGYSLKDILRGMDKKKLFSKIDKKGIVTLLILALILLEFAVFPCPVFKVDVPQFYRQISAESDDYAILEVPSKNAGLMSEYMYYQTIHEKKLVGGYLSRTPGYATAFVEDTPVISYFVNLRSDILDQNYSRIGGWLLERYGIRYVVIHKNHLNESEFEDVSDLSKKIFNDAPPVYEDDVLVVYKVKKVYTPPIYLACEANFYSAEIWGDGYPGRWMDNNATLAVVNTKDYDVDTDITFSVLSFERSRTLEVRANNMSVYNTTVSIPEERVTISNVTLHAGKNIIEFYTPEGSETVDGMRHNKDMRMVSLGLRNISVDVRED